MKHKNKPRVLISSEQSFFSKLNINFKLISQFIAPLMFLLTAGILIVLAQWAVLTKRGDSFTVGAPSPETFRVISQMRYDDQASAKTLRSMVNDSVVGVMVRDVSAKSRLQRRLEAIRDMKDNTPKNTGYLAVFPEPLLRAVLRLTEEEKAKILNMAYKIGSAYIDRLEAEKVFRGNTALMSSILWSEINKENLPSNEANFVYQILMRLGNLNVRIDEDLTDLTKRAAVNDVPVIDRKLEPGDVIVSKGDIVTAQTAILLRLQGYTEDVFPVTQLVIVVLCVLAMPLIMNILSKGAGDHKPTLNCVVFIMLAAWGCETFAARLGIYGAGVLPAVSVAFLCVQDYLAFCLAIMASSSGVFIITGQAVSHQIILSVLAVFSSIAGFYLMRGSESRSQVSRRIFMMSFILTVLKMSIRATQGPPFVRDNFRLFIPLGEFWQEAGLFFFYELLMTHMLLVVLQYFEEFLGTLSILSIREISHPSSPLLRDMQRNAPGTYQHCLTIATLIEAVGIKLGMDANLLRAGAYYHDIGKLRKPQYFVENQGGGVNAHDDMSPMLSSLTIISHVKDGLELAWEAHLPKRIRDFIAEHHGTTCTRYFYNKAVASGENVEWSSFCYPGPRPQSRETALLMIVDSVEAAVRAANIRELEAEDSNRDKGKTVSAIEKIVNQVVTSKINENQFDDVNFTLKDLTLIKQTLISVLISMYHTRKVKKIVRSEKTPNR
ncbi:MAG: HDIG domain-containing protein [Synergistaceae bacterium]|nr:HDIG domain-containing protein [Synergistaceae bacterium]